MLKNLRKSEYKVNFLCPIPLHYTCPFPPPPQQQQKNLKVLRLDSVWWKALVWDKQVIIWNFQMIFAEMKILRYAFSSEHILWYSFGYDRNINMQTITDR